LALQFPSVCELEDDRYLKAQHPVSTAMSELSNARANLPRSALPKWPTATLYPPDRLPTMADFNAEWSDWK
jgi:hypothetical protein